MYPKDVEWKANGVFNDQKGAVWSRSALFAKTKCMPWSACQTAPSLVRVSKFCSDYLSQYLE